MKRALLLIATAASAAPALAQLPVSTTPQNRKVVLEEFTGIHCVYCPDGHKRANDLKAAKPAGSVILVNIHTGGYATPGSGEPDFRTAEGNAIAAISGMGITGYPTGSVNRHLWTGQSGFAISRSLWSQYADSILAKPSYVNVAMQGTLNVATRVLTVNVEAYYTATTTAPNNLTVMLLEDDVTGPQTGAANFYPSQINVDNSYTHNHLLRKVLTTSATGEVLPTTTVGTTVTRTYTYTVPAQYVNNAAYVGNLRLAGFIAQGNSEIMTAAYGPITLTGFTNTRDAEMLTGILSENEVCAGRLDPIVKMYNNGSAAITSASLTVNANGAGAATASYTGNIAPGSWDFVDLPTYNFTPQATNTLNVIVSNVNGQADQNTANNTVSKTGITLTNRTAAGTMASMEFTQDRYGSESSWKVYNDATNAVVAQGGPYSDLSANGTLLHSTPFALTPNTCYRVEVLDSYGDGINSGTGAGNYKIVSNGATVYSSNGQFTTKQTSTYKSNATLTKVGDISAVAGQVVLHPNPARETAVLEFVLNTAGTVRVSVVDAAGRTVQSGAEMKLGAGAQKANINTAALPAGLYMVRLQTEQGAINERLTVVK